MLFDAAVRMNSDGPRSMVVAEQRGERGQHHRYCQEHPVPCRAWMR